jgi:hypothetical protein
VSFEPQPATPKINARRTAAQTNARWNIRVTKLRKSPTAGPMVRANCDRVKMRARAADVEDDGARC